MARVEVAEAKAPEGRRKGKKVLRHVEIRHARGKGGEEKGRGFIVTHHFEYQPGMMGSHEPEEHIFGHDEGHDMLAHVANALGVPEPKGESSEGQERSTKEDEAADKAENSPAAEEDEEQEEEGED